MNPYPYGNPSPYASPYPPAYEAYPPSTSHVGLFIGLGVGALVIGGGVGLYLYTRSSSASAPSITTGATTTTAGGPIDANGFGSYLSGTNTPFVIQALAGDFNVSVASPTSLVLANASGTDKTQQFTLSTSGVITNLNDNLVLTAGSNGQLTMAAPTGSSNQQWTYNQATSHLTNKSTGLVLDTGGSVAQAQGDTLVLNVAAPLKPSQNFFLMPASAV